MKAARKVGDAKKHECTLHHLSQKTSSDPLRSKTRVLGLIRSNPLVVLCIHSHPLNIVYALRSRVFHCT